LRTCLAEVQLPPGPSCQRRCGRDLITTVTIAACEPAAVFGRGDRSTTAVRPPCRSSSIPGRTFPRDHQGVGVSRVWLLVRSPTERGSSSRGRRRPTPTRGPR
jgi:hypothetical protein